MSVQIYVNGPNYWDGHGNSVSRLKPIMQNMPINFQNSINGGFFLGGNLNNSGFLAPPVSYQMFYSPIVLNNASEGGIKQKNINFIQGGLNWK